MMAPVKNATISLAVYAASLFVMLVVFKWGIYAVVVGRIVFSGSACILNAHSLREQIGYVQEQKKTFMIPSLAALIMGVVTLAVHLLFEVFIGARIATVLVLPIAMLVYGISMILLGGITEAELYDMPKGTLLVRACHKVRLFR